MIIMVVLKVVHAIKSFCLKVQTMNFRLSLIGSLLVIKGFIV